MLAAGNDVDGLYLYELDIGEARLRRVTSGVTSQLHIGLVRDDESGTLYWVRRMGGGTAQWVIDRLDQAYRTTLQLSSESLPSIPGFADRIMLDRPVVMSPGGSFLASDAVARLNGANRAVIAVFDRATLRLDTVIDGFRLWGIDRQSPGALLAARATGLDEDLAYIYRLEIATGRIDSTPMSESVFVAPGALAGTLYVARGTTLRLIQQTTGAEVASRALPFVGVPSLLGSLAFDSARGIIVVGDMGSFDFDGTGIVEVLDAISLTPVVTVQLPTEPSSAGRSVVGVGVSPRLASFAVLMGGNPASGGSAGYVRTYEPTGQARAVLGPFHFQRQMIVW